MIYLLHFDTPYEHARHYIGWTESEATLPARLRHHENGTGSRLMRAVCNSGITFQVARVWPEGTKDEERRLKNHKNAKRFCPVCSPDAHRHARVQAEELEEIPF